MRLRTGKTRLISDESARTWILIGIHVLVMLAVLVFCDIKYEVSDDFVMELLASGAFSGTPDAHLMFCSYLWGQFLNLLYGLAPGISWYFWAQIGVGFLACCAAAFYLGHTARLSRGVLMTVLIAAFFARDLYLLPQFTKTAAAAIAGGGFLLLWGLFHRKWGGAVFGAIVTVLGCLLRHNSLFVVGGFLFLYLVYELVCLLRRREKDTGKRLLWIFGWGGVFLALVFGLRYGNNLAYQTDEAYRYYIDYSYTRAYIVDYPLPDYSECAEELQKIGISENDYELIAAWSFGDQEVFSLETMDKVLAIVDQHRPEVYTSFLDVLKRFVGRGTLWYPGTVCCVILAVIGLWFSRKRFVITAAAGALTVGLMLRFIWIGHSVYRVEFGYLFAAALLLIYVMPAETRARLRDGLCYLLAGVVLVSQIPGYVPDQSYRGLSAEEYRTYVDSTFDFSWDYLKEKYTKCVNERTIRPAFLEEVREHPEHLYLLDFNTTIQSLYFDYSPFESPSAGAFRNMVYLGGVTVNHPVIQETLEQWGVKDALPALLEEEVYFVSNTTSQEALQFLREHYDKDATVELYKELDGYQIWKYQSGKKS